jgi:hypothetical protein
MLVDAMIDGTGRPPRPGAAIAIVGDRIEVVCDHAEVSFGPGGCLISVCWQSAIEPICSLSMATWRRI